MCLAIFKPAGKDIKPEHLENASIQNPDGGGIAYATGEELIIRKGYFDGSETINNLLQDLTDYPAVVHFRWSTQGLTDKKNCHPFRIEEWAMIHNGHISCMPDDKKRSDTYLYAKRRMKRRIRSNNNWPLLDRANKKMAKEIGGSKLVFLRADGESVIINEKKGDWVDGIWYSNDSYKEPVYYFHQPYTYTRSSGSTVTTYPGTARGSNDWHLPLGYDNEPMEKDAQGVLDFEPSRSDGYASNIDTVDPDDDDQPAYCDVCFETIKEGSDYMDMGVGGVCMECWGDLESEHKEMGFSCAQEYYAWCFSPTRNT